MPNKKTCIFGIKKFVVGDSKTSYISHIELNSGTELLQENPFPFTENDKMSFPNNFSWIIHALLAINNPRARVYVYRIQNRVTRFFGPIEISDDTVFSPAKVDPSLKDIWLGVH